MWPLFFLELDISISHTELGSQIMNRTYAFIDESGNHDLETKKQGASNYFIVAAVLTSDSKISSLKAGAELIRKKFFQNGEIKSSAISSKDYQRRINIINEIMRLDFKYYVLAINKERVYKDSSLRFKKTFLKNISGRMCSSIFASHPQVSVYADGHGSPAFQQSLESYIQKKHSGDLFYHSDFRLVDSKDNVLIQLADIIAGTTAHIYEGKAHPALREVYRALVGKLCLSIDEWPLIRTLAAQNDPSSEIDSLIHSHAVRAAQLFISENEESLDHEVKMQVCLLRHLLFNSIFLPSSDYISTYSLLSHLKDQGFYDAKQQAIRSSIVAKLRSKGVIISSSSKGYKIPRNFADFHDFVERVDGIVVPLLERLKIARDSYKLASGTGIDLLAGVKYPKLVALLDLLDQQQLLPPSKV